MVHLDQEESSQTIFRLTTKNVIPCLSVNPMASFLIRIQWEKPFGILNKSQISALGAFLFFHRSHYLKKGDIFLMISNYDSSLLKFLHGQKQFCVTILTSMYLCNGPL